MYGKLPHQTAPDRRPDPRPSGLKFAGVLDCRTPAEREADERAGRTWEQIEAEAVAELRAMKRGAGR